MRRALPVTLAIVILLVVGFELYVFKGVRTLSASFDSAQSRSITHIVYWALTAFLAISFVYAMMASRAEGSPVNSKTLTYIMGVFFLFTVPKIIFFAFHFFDDVFTGIGWLINKVQASTPAPDSGEGMTRSAFLTKVGLGAAAIPFIAISWGILKGRYDFRVRRHTLQFDNLPGAFHGLKVVQLSDIHIGSFFDNHAAVEKGIEMVMDLKPDLILFTGDMVNNVAQETDGWAPILSRLKAPLGVYSVLGNHDYGDYVNWSSVQDKAANLERLKRVQREEFGMDLLLNENRILSKDGEQIALLGVENWGKPPFVQYGDLAKSMQGTDDEGFQLLMSHDPSHWDEQVLGKTKIDLTLSGHTHGMQFGIEIPGIKWSPVKYRYPRWGGLYPEGKQRLYVNRGFGYIGFPGRVGILPEITLLELQRTDLA